MSQHDSDDTAPNSAREPRVYHATWRWDGAGLEIVVAELPGVLVLVPTLADAALATRKRIARELGLLEAEFEVDLKPANAG